MSMNLLKLLRRRTGSAPVARERLQILLAHERGLRSQPDLLGILREEILAVVDGAAGADAYAIPRRSSYCGQFMAHSGWYPDHVTRLFRRGSARFSDDVVHEKLVAQGRVDKLRNDLLHHSFPDLESVLDKLDRYSTAGAQRMHRQGKRASLSSAVLHGLWAFIRTYFLQRGFRDGRMGFVLAVSNAEGTYYRYLKLWLSQRRP
jgi:hypothetical protein